MNTGVQLDKGTISCCAAETVWGIDQYSLSLATCTMQLVLVAQTQSSNPPRIIRLSLQCLAHGAFVLALVDVT